MMKSNVSGWVVGGLFAMAVVGVGLNGNAVANASAGTEPWVVSNMNMQQEKSTAVKDAKGQETQKPCGDAAAKTEATTAPDMMQNGKMSPDMMQSPEMQQQCGEMMKNADMQKMMQAMTKDVDMQKMMKQMMANDPTVEDMMKSMVSAGEGGSNTAAVTEQEHNAHHSS